MSEAIHHRVISEDWVQRTGEAIATRNGVALKDSISRAEAGEAFTLNSDNNKAISFIIKKLEAALRKATTDAVQRFPVARSGKSSQNAVAEAAAKDEEERSHCIQTAVRVAVTGSLIAFQRKERKVVQQVAVSSPTGTGASPIDVDGAGAIESEAAALHRSSHDALLKGLLFAFETFVPMHAMNRDHYPPRVGNKTAGTVGWDTLVLLHFVHHIPQIAREASGAVIDDATGELVRSWRKLLVALQTVDANEAAEHSRRRGALALVNGLLIIMFQRYNTHQCGVFLSAVEHAESVAQRLGDSGKSILQPSQHMVSEVVTYHYYRGRMYLYERRFPEAHEALREAYHLLPISSPSAKRTTVTDAQRHNKQRVRFFLMVAGLLSGRGTPQAIRDADPLLSAMFAPLVDAIEHGNPVAFGAALEIDGAVWRRRGVYLLLQQQGRLLCYLMLLARTHAAVGSLPGKDNSRVTLANLIAAYSCICGKPSTFSSSQAAVAGGKEANAASSTPKAAKGKKRPRAREEVVQNLVESVEAAEEAAMNDDRMALWVVKLIARGYVRGYLSHEHKTIVLSKADPFPLLRPSVAPAA